MTVTPLLLGVGFTLGFILAAMMPSRPISEMIAAEPPAQPMLAPWRTMNEAEVRAWRRGYSDGPIVGGIGQWRS